MPILDFFNGEVVSYTISDSTILELKMNESGVIPDSSL